VESKVSEVLKAAAIRNIFLKAAEICKCGQLISW